MIQRQLKLGMDPDFHHRMCAACEAVHARDVNAAMHILTAGVGTTHECHRKVAPGIPWL